jgi:hypothetical protein
MIKKGNLTASVVSSTPNPMVYAGFINQVSTNAPTIDLVLDNFSGITLQRTSEGTYTASKTGGFPSGRTFPGITHAIESDEDGNVFKAVWTDVNTITFTSETSAGVLTDGLYINRQFVIQVFEVIV